MVDWVLIYMSFFIDLFYKYSVFMNIQKIKTRDVLLSAEPFPVRFNAKQYKIKKKQMKNKSRCRRGSYLIRRSLICALGLITSDSSLQKWMINLGRA